MRCGSCGEPAAAGTRFCPHCGTAHVQVCESCGAALVEGARFCAACGTAVSAPAAPGPAVSGPAVSGPAGLPALDAGPAPGGATDVFSILSKRSDDALAPRDLLPRQPVAERRVTSVLFGDLVGFTTLSETRDPEDVRELLSGYFQRCRVIVARYGGTIEKFIGDAVMAVWGVPVAHEDDAERAVRAGLELVEAVAGFGEEAGAAGLALRVGIVTDEVAVTLGAQAEGMVAGDAVNTAARVQSQATPGTVWVDRQTRSLTEAAIDFVSTGFHSLKGKAEPVALFEVVAVMDAVGGSARPAQVEAALVGRRRELGVIKETFHATAEDGRGRLLIVAGEPGVGKSRLGWELQKYLDGLTEPVRWHWGRALAYGDGVAFSPLTAAVRGRVGVNDDDDAATVSAKVEASLAGLIADPTERAWLEPCLSVLLSGATDRQFSRGELFSAWLTWFEALGTDATAAVWVIDDAHLADEGVLDFAEHLVASVRAPVLVVVLARPELLLRRPQLATSRRSTVVNLEGLSPIAMGGLIDRLVPDLPAAALDRVIDRAEGIPLYAVEIIRGMRDQGLLRDRGDGTHALVSGTTAQQLAAVAAPTSLRVLISSRLDALAPTDRSLLGTAAVLGTSYTAEALAALTGAPTRTIIEQLQPLLQRDLIRIVTNNLSGENGQYAFVQTIVRQVAYQTQSRRDRAARHLAAADYLQTLTEATGQLSAVIAGHLSDARGLLPANDPRWVEANRQAMAWQEKAGDRARSIGAPMEALASYETALAQAHDPAVVARLHLAAADAAIVAGRYELAVSHAVRVPREQPITLLARADTAHGQAERRSGHNAEAVNLLTPWLQRLDELPAAEASDLTRELAFSLHQLGDLERAVPVGERAMRLAEDSGRPDLIARALNVLGVHDDIRGLWRSARARYAEAAAFARANDLTTELGFLLQNLSAIELSRDLSAGIRTAREALDLAQQTGHTSQANYAATNLIEGMRTVGRWDEAIAVSVEPVIDDSIASGLLDVHQIGLDLGLIALARGELPPSITFRADPTGDAMSAALAAAARGDAASAFECGRDDLLAKHELTGLDEEFTVTWTATLDWGIDAGRLDEARMLLALVENAPAGHLTPILHAQLLRLRGSLAAADPGASTDAVATDLSDSVTELIELAALPYAARAQAALGAWLVGQHRDAEAGGLLDSARATFEALRARHWLTQLEEQLTIEPAQRAN